jgi:hypothetical protein
MAKLSAKARAKVPTKKFGLPDKAKGAKAKKRSANFPMPDKPHAEAALRLLPRSVKAGNTSAAEAATVRAKAHKILNS